MGPKQGNLDSHQSFNDDDDDLYGHKYEAMYGADVPTCRREIFLHKFFGSKCMWQWHLYYQ
jgi:hypothetical protein